MGRSVEVPIPAISVIYVICVISLKRYLAESCGQTVVKVVSWHANSMLFQEARHASKLSEGFGRAVAEKPQIVEAGELTVDLKRPGQQFRMVRRFPSLHLIASNRDQRRRFFRRLRVHVHEQLVTLEREGEPFEEIDRGHRRDLLADSWNPCRLIGTVVIDKDLLWCNAQRSRQLKKLDNCQIELAPDLDVADDLRAEAFVRDSSS
ncbi:hypothetical protein ASD43_02415 [Microbacterium sp. Root553]|nr:hypothetical protein ASD43_02415 [Microbacterium sp. Root553]